MRLFLAHLPLGANEEWVRYLFRPHTVSDVWVVSAKNIAFVGVDDDVGEWAIKNLDGKTHGINDGYNGIVVKEAQARTRRIDVRAMRMAGAERRGYEINVETAAAIVAVSRRTWERWEAGKPIPPGPVKLFCSETGLPFNEWDPIIGS